METFIVGNHLICLNGVLLVSPTTYVFMQKIMKLLLVEKVPDLELCLFQAIFIFIKLLHFYSQL